MDSDISSVLRTTLVNLGVSPEKVGKFDLHSSLEMHFHNMDPIIISVNGGRVWVWSAIKSLSHYNIEYHAPKLLLSLQGVLPWVVTGQAVLGKGDCYEIKALADEEAIASPQKFSELLDGFYNVAADVYRIINNR
ncbi:hypothetical protein [Burkholderia contaminans]|uniref:InvB/SpaK family type III secretion system chaperone n=1 Tax=Burkholderia contaminans TaxID=488447 RepID=UPI000B11398E|nr:hypothetical protein [Burkholderia contaminans]